MSLSIIIPTSGRWSLNATLLSITPQLEPGDEIIVVRDSSDDWGMKARNEAMRRAKGTWLAFMDDDDIYLPGALALMRAVTGPTIFRMRRGSPHNDVLWTDKELRPGNVSTQMFVTPCIPLGRWGNRYEGDFDFIASTLDLYPVGALTWRQEQIAVWRPN